MVATRLSIVVAVAVSDKTDDEKDLKLFLASRSMVCHLHGVLTANLRVPEGHSICTYLRNGGYFTLQHTTLTETLDACCVSSHTTLESCSSSCVADCCIIDSFAV